MKTTLAPIARPASGFRLGRRLLRAGLAATPLTIALALALTFVNGCYCPEPSHATPVVDSPKHAEAIRQQLVDAQKNQVWTATDEGAFRKNLKHLSPQTRIATATQLARLINSKAVRIDRSAPKTEPAPTCPCAPGSCDMVPVPTPTPVPAPPPTTSVPPPPGAPPATRVK